MTRTGRSAAALDAAAASQVRVVLDAPDTVVLGADALTALAGLPDACVDAIICDPPYGLANLPAAKVAGTVREWLGGNRAAIPSGRGFMGREWDAFVPPPAIWDECLRVLRPGGHLAAFAAPRTVDLMGLSIRLAGFEVRDTLMWLRGDGMPKSQDLGKVIDKQKGAERTVVGYTDPHNPRTARARSIMGSATNPDTVLEGLPITEPATDEAKQWAGWGSSLKPAHEPIVLARKPLDGTLINNALTHGVGPLNIDGTRVAHASPADRAESEGKNTHAQFGTKPTKNSVYNDYSMLPVVDYDGSAGRFPPNVLLSHDPECVPTGRTTVVTGDKRPGGEGEKPAGYSYDVVKPGDGKPAGVLYPDQVVSVWDCAEGCPVAAVDAQSGVRKGGGFPTQRGAGKHTSFGVGQPTEGGARAMGDVGGASRFFPTVELDPEGPAFAYAGRATNSERPTYLNGAGERVSHVSVKPVAVIAWLCRLLLPPGGVALDPFAGSGTLLEAARREGACSVLVEREPTYWPLALARHERSAAAETEPVQPSLLDG